MVEIHVFACGPWRPIGGVGFLPSLDSGIRVVHYYFTGEMSSLDSVGFCQQDHAITLLAYSLPSFLQLLLFMRLILDSYGYFHWVI